MQDLEIESQITMTKSRWTRMYQDNDSDTDSSNIEDAKEIGDYGTTDRMERET